MINYCEQLLGLGSLIMPRLSDTLIFFFFGLKGILKALMDLIVFFWQLGCFPIGITPYQSMLTVLMGGSAASTPP